MPLPLVPLALRRTLDEYGRLLREAFGERLLSFRLFGSRARGDADVDSDADVSVVVRELTDPERGAAVDLAYEAWRHAGRMGPLVSPLVWSEVELRVRCEGERRIALDIEREGVAL